MTDTIVGIEVNVADRDSSATFIEGRSDPLIISVNDIYKRIEREKGERVEKIVQVRSSYRDVDGRKDHNFSLNSDSCRRHASDFARQCDDRCATHARRRRMKVAR